MVKRTLARPLHTANAHQRTNPQPIT